MAFQEQGHGYPLADVPLGREVRIREFPARVYLLHDYFLPIFDRWNIDLLDDVE